MGRVWLKSQSVTTVYARPMLTKRETHRHFPIPRTSLKSNPVQRTAKWQKTVKKSVANLETYVGWQQFCKKSRSSTKTNIQLERWMS